MAELYEVSINAIEEYEFSNPIDVIYNPMWLEEEFLYYEIKFDTECYEQIEYKEIVQEVINEWQEMRDKREIYEILDEEYLEWKLNYDIKKNNIKYRKIHDFYDIIISR